MTTTPISEPTGAEGATRAAGWVARGSLRWLWWLPVVLGGLYGIAILTHLPAILHATWLSSDSDIDAVLAHASIHARAGALLTTGDYPHYETMAFTLLTRSWPFYRTLWVVGPVLFAAAGLAAVLWSVLRSFGRWPAGVVGAALLCFGGGGVAMTAAGGLATVFAIDAHANSLISAALVAAGLVWIVPRVQRLSAPRLAGSALVLGILGGLPLAGDSLYLAWGVAPLAVVTVLAAWRGPEDRASRTLSFGIGALAATVLTGVALASIMHAQGIRGFAPSHRAFMSFATPGRIVTNFETLLRALPSLTAGSFYGKPVMTRSELQFVSASLLFAALAAVVWCVRRRIANALPRAAGGGDPVAERFVHTTFWVTALGAGLAIFMIGSPNPWTTDGRYLLGPYVAVAALLPLLLERGLGWKLVVTVAVSLFVLSALDQFSSGVREMSTGYQTTRTADAVAAFAKRERVAVGYGDYWHSLDLTWESGFRVPVYPVQPCERDRQLLCTFEEITMTGWDSPHGNVRSMLVLDPTGRGLHSPERALGRAIASTRIGDLALYVYPYDIAKRLRYQAGLTL